MTDRAQRAGLVRVAAAAVDWLTETRTRHRRAIALTAYAAISTVAYVSSYLLRFEFSIPERWLRTLLVTLPVLLVVRVSVFWSLGLARGRWRFVGVEDAFRLVMTTATGSIAFFLLDWTSDLLPRVPRSVILIEWFVTTLLIGGLWLGYRLVVERTRHVRVERPREDKRVLIVGAGEAGNLLAREIRRLPNGYALVGFVDDDPRMRGSTLRGVEVLGDTTELPDIAGRTSAGEIIIAVPSATPDQLRQIVGRCRSLDLPFKVLPGIAEVLEGDVSVGQLRELRIEDLLGREPVSLELPEVESGLRGRSVMITGGAGSIGAELARQVALYDPSSLVILDRAESDLYFLQRDLDGSDTNVEVVPVVADILDERSLKQAFDEHRPHRVFHAAAYKHVPLMESNVRQAIRNNVLGTRAVARAAGESGAEAFTLISTDKAVDPVNVMGATKRVAERVCVAYQQIYPDTSFVAVRFGNVLGSHGSVIPLFRRQLRAGRALTVTHPHVSRYFMTVSEAAQLVLQASTLEEARGQITMLDMGRPVRILDLARNLIRLSGLNPDRDVPIEIVGLRPGEKLHEELEGPGETTEPTAFEKVRLIRAETAAPASPFLSEIDVLERECGGTSEAALRARLFELVGVVERQDRSELVASRRSN